MVTLTDIIAELIETDTHDLINRSAQAILANPTQSVPLPSEMQAFGIILLAVDDAKTSDRPSSQNALYLDASRMTKERLNDK